MVLAGSLLGAGAAAAQEEVTLTLDEAVAQALEGNAALAAAEHRAAAAERGAEARDGFLFPALQATAGAVRTDDPGGVFGTKLRQGIFGPADFDIPALNSPAAVSDWTAGLGARWEVASYHRWVERTGAQAQSRAARAMAERTREGTLLMTRILYVDAVRAAAALEAVQAAETSAASTLERVRRRVEEGMGTEADLLQAQAALSGIQARVGQAEANVADAREALGNHLGWDPARMPVPAQGADDVAASLDAGDTGETDLFQRADLVAGRAAVQAAEAEADAVTARRLPSVEAFGQLSTHAPGIGDDREANWTLGVQVSVPVFTGFSLTRGAEAARMQAEARAMEQAQREREAETEVRSARRNVEAARRAQASARAAAGAAQEAVRLLRRRYEEGMATLADLLQAEAQAAALDQGVVDADANLGMALAALDFARGAEPRDA